MSLLLSLPLLLYWVFVPTLLSAVLPPAGRLGRDGTAVLLALVSWAVLLLWLPVHIWPPHPLAQPAQAAILAGLALLYAGVFVAGIRPSAQIPDGGSPKDNPVTVAFLSPLSEEILFRGFLMALALPVLGGYGAAAFTALLFLSAHEVGRIGGARRTRRESLADLSFGLLAGVLYLATGTILAPLALHVLINASYALGTSWRSS